MLSRTLPAVATPPSAAGVPEWLSAARSSIAKAFRTGAGIVSGTYTCGAVAPAARMPPAKAAPFSAKVLPWRAKNLRPASGRSAPLAGGASPAALPSNASAQLCEQNSSLRPAMCSKPASQVLHISDTLAMRRREPAGEWPAGGGPSTAPAAAATSTAAALSSPRRELAARWAAAAAADGTPLALGPAAASEAASPALVSAAGSSTSTSMMGTPRGRQARAATPQRPGGAPGQRPGGAPGPSAAILRTPLQGPLARAEAAVRHHQHHHARATDTNYMIARV